MKKLSERQRAILDFIKDFVEDKSYPPTVRDIQKGCEISSTSVVDYNLRLLEGFGLIRRDRDVSRGIELLGKTAPKKRANFVPVLGTIAAGQPIPVPDADAWKSSAWETVQVAEEMVRGKKGVYALKVKGNSMIDALVEDGDIVLLESTSSAQNGDMVAAWLKNEKETTLKKLYREKRRVRLQPANSQMSPIYTSPNNLEIQGKVIGVVRVMS